MGTPAQEGIGIGEAAIRAYVSRIQDDPGAAADAFASDWWEQNVTGEGLSLTALKSSLRELASAAIAAEDDYGHRNELTIIYSDFIYGISISDDGDIWRQYFVTFSQRVGTVFRSISKSRGNNQIFLIKKYITEHLPEALSLVSVAEQFYLNPSYLSRLFKEKTGSTFGEYVSSQRIEAAKQLLSATDLPIADIAVRVGYEVPDSFSRLFKKSTGLPPQKYRSMRTAPKEFSGIRNAPAIDLGPCALAGADQNYADFFTKR